MDSLGLNRAFGGGKFSLTISILWFFGVVSLAAVLIAAAHFASQEIISLGVAAVVLGILARSFWLPVDQRSRVQATLAAMYLPFVWIIAYNKPFGHTSGMIHALYRF